MQDRTINNALLALRRAGGDTQIHAEALLTIRGIDLPPIQRKSPVNRFRQRELKTLVIAALRDESKTGKAIAAYIAERRPVITQEQAYSRLYQALWRYQAAGLVRREGRVWSLGRR